MTRFARAVERVTGSPDREESLTAGEAVTLLQREHAAVVREIRHMKKKIVASTFGVSRECAAYHKACDDLLAWLHERGR